ncbi:hypothetical protein RB195_009857 [Necator americanus]|uniref:Uncharacterized protein n=1 Tax=Necator americanus TaxID=51031 RepID=A0ABR1CWG1_NECAM
MYQVSAFILTDKPSTNFSTMMKGLVGTNAESNFGSIMLQPLWDLLPTALHPQFAFMLQTLNDEGVVNVLSHGKLHRLGHDRRRLFQTRFSGLPSEIERVHGYTRLEQ